MTPVATPLTSMQPTDAEKRAKRRPREPLTRPERDILLGLERAIRLHGNPSLREIAELAGPTFYASTAHKYLRQLEVKGYVAMPTVRYRMRGVRLLFTAPPLKKKKAVKQ